MLTIILRAPFIEGNMRASTQDIANPVPKPELPEPLFAPLKEPTVFIDNVNESPRGTEAYSQRDPEASRGTFQIYRLDEIEESTDLKKVLAELKASVEGLNSFHEKENKRLIIENQSLRTQRDWLIVIVSLFIIVLWFVLAHWSPPKKDEDDVRF